MAHFRWSEIVSISWNFSHTYDNNDNYDQEDVEWEMRRFSNDRCLSNLSRLLSTNFCYERSFNSFLFEMIWGGCQIMTQLKRSSNDEATVLRVFDLLLDLTEEAEDQFGFMVGEDFPHQFLDDVLAASTALLGPGHVMVLKFWLLKIFFEPDAADMCRQFLAMPHSTAHLRYFEGMFSVPGPNTPHIEDYESDLLRGIRYCFSLGLLYVEADALNQAAGCFERGLACLRSKSDAAVAAAVTEVDRCVEWTLCWCRLSRAMAAVYLRLGNPVQALVVLRECISQMILPVWGLTHQLPTSYVTFLGQLVSHQNMEAIEGLELSQFNIPGRLLEDAALFLVAWVADNRAGRPLLLMERTSLFLVGRLNSELQDDRQAFGLGLLNAVRLIWRTKYNLQAAAATHAPDALQAQLDYIRVTRGCRRLDVWLELEDVDGTFYPFYQNVLSQAVITLSIVHTQHPQLRSCMANVANFLLGKYSVQQPDGEGEEVFAVAPQLYRALEDVMLLLQNLSSFLVNHMLARYACHFQGAIREDRQLASHRLERYRTVGFLLQAACRRTDTDAAKRLSLLFTEADSVLNAVEQNFPILGTSAVQRLPSLLQLSYPVVLSSVQATLQRLETLFQCPETLPISVEVWRAMFKFQIQMEQDICARAYVTS